MGYSYTLTALIPASPKDIYDTWLDSRGHSAMTGGKATQSAKMGAAVTAWDDYITGKNLHLEPGKRIVQTWRTTQFTDAHGDSVITVTLIRIPGGTHLTLNHANVPDDQTSYEQSGWKDHYFTPMQRYFMTMTNVKAVMERAKKATKKALTRKKAAKKTAKKPVKKKNAAKKSVRKSSKKKSAKKRAPAPRKRRKR